MRARVAIALGDFTLFPLFVELDSPALFARQILEAPTRGIERFVDRNATVAVNALGLHALAVRLAFGVRRATARQRLVAAHNRLCARNRQLDTDMESSPLALMAMRDFYKHAAAHEGGEDMRQPRHSLADVRLERFRRRQAAKGHVCLEGRHEDLAIRVRAD